MQRVQVLKEQAAILRSLARSFEAVPALREDLLRLGERCEQLAADVEREIRDRLRRPISG